MLTSKKLLLCAACSFPLCVLFGCGTGLSTVSPANTTLPVQPHGTITGKVHGGQQPVSNGAVYLFAVANTGYAQSATSLLSGVGVAVDAHNNGYVLTDSTGSFSITGDYNCPSGNSLVYLLAMGGNPGLAAGTNNSAMTLAAALGNCAALKLSGAATMINVNELTTVATAYALAGFASSSTQVGASSTNLVGITNAFATASALVDTSTGLAPLLTPGGNGSVPQSELDTLADVLAPCVNSDGTITGAPSPSACFSLFSATTINGNAPSDTFQAVLNIAHAPSSNVAALFMLSEADAPFQPTLNGAPNDWTVALNYTGSGIATPQSVAIDANGNAWIANAANTITELAAALGNALSGTNGFTAAGLDAPVSLAIDTQSNVWIANCSDPCSASGNPSSVTRLSSNGQSSVTFNSAGFSGAYSIAISGDNHSWIANSVGSSLTQLDSAGNVTLASNVAPNLIYPVSVALDSNGNALAVSPADDSIVAFTASGTPDSTDAYHGSNLSFPYAIAVDHNGHLWVANHGNNTIAQLSAGSAVGSSPYSGAGISTPVAIALDGAGNVWAANTTNTLSELSNSGAALSPSTGLRNDLAYPNSIAIDGSGNVWVTNCGHYCEPASASSGSVSLIVGAATPVVTPLALGAAHNTLASQP